MNNVTTFDTLAYAKELQRGGFTQKQAETQAHAQAKFVGSIIEEKFVTKEDLFKVENRLERRVERIEQRLGLVEKSLARLNNRLNRLPALITIGFVALGVLIKLH